jgi:hypothetical protein
MEHEIGSKRSLPRRQFSSQRKQHRQLCKCCFCIKRTAVRPFAGEGSRSITDVVERNDIVTRLGKLQKAQGSGGILQRFSC